MKTFQDALIKSDMKDSVVSDIYMKREFITL